jgi:CrcB protein
VLLAVIFAGGFLGGLARYGLVVAFPTGGATFPVTILAVNTAGAFALAVIVVVAAEGLAAGSALRHYLRPGLGTGFCGAFTTFSSVVTAGDLLTAHGHVVIAALYLVASVAAGLAATVLGARVAGRMVG